MAVTLPGRKASYTGSELARIVVWVGFRGTAAALAVAIILAESGGRTRAQGRNGPTRGCSHGSLDRGLAQINSCYHSEVSDTCAYDPYCNVSAMWRISGHGRNFHPWSTYNSGAYRRYFSAAAEWVGNVQQAGGVGPSIPTPVRQTGRPSSLNQALDWVLGPLNWGPVGWLKSHIKAVVSVAGHYVYDKLHPLIHDVGVAARDALHLAQHVYNVLKHDVHAVYVWTQQVINGVKQWVRIGLRDLESWTRRLIGDVYTWVRRDIWGPLDRAYHGVLNWVKTTVIPFLERAIRTVESWAHAAVHWLTRLIGDLKYWAEHAVGWLIDHVRQAVEWVARFGAKVWGIIDKCWWFLVFVAEHPLDWWIILLRDLASRAPQMLGNLAAATMRTIGDEIEQVIAKWLSG